jgi:perosamine synthetase
MRLRCLAPVAAPNTVADLASGLRGAVHPERALAALREDLRTTLGVGHVFLVSSGRAALTLVLKALARGSTRRRVIVPAYACFSVAASVIKAGLELALCDIDPASLDFDFTELGRLLQGSPPLCVLSVHLFGRPADTSRTVEMCRSVDAAVIEDAAQGFGFRQGDRWLGTAGDAGFYSFGRGKTVSACGGGAIVTRSSALGALVRDQVASSGRPSLAAGVTTLAMSAAVSVLVRPRLYGLPAHTPGLGLGETHFSTGFSISAMNGAQAGTLQHALHRLTALNEHRQSLVRFFRTLTGNLAAGEQGPLLRLPVLCRSRAVRDSLLERSRETGLGVVRMYPSSLGAVPELLPVLGGGRYPGADLVAERLVTVPLHQFVDEADAASIRTLVETCQGN